MCKRRELESTGVRWNEPSRAVRGSQTFKHIYSVVHHGDTHELEFDFDALSDQEKEHLIMRAAPLCSKLTLTAFLRAVSSHA